MNKQETLQQLNHIREFQINDLKKADEAGTNFLVCIGCLNATEILGGIRTGYLGQENQVTSRLKSGLDLLAGVYKHHQDDFISLRHSMVHAYLGKTRNYSDVDIMYKDDPALNWLPLNLGIQIVNGRFVVNTSSWISDLEAAWDKLERELKADDRKLAKVDAALKKLPHLR